MSRPTRTEFPSSNRRDWQTIRSLLPYLWRHRWRLGIALLFLVLAKLANVGVPLALKAIVDRLDTGAVATVAALPLALLIAYGLLRLGTSAFGELRNAVFAKAAQNTIRRMSVEVFRHLHALSLRFHLDRQTGGLSRDIERGGHSVGQFLNYTIFSIVPTLFEMIAVTVILLLNYRPAFAGVTLATIAVYSVYTWKISNWRIRFRVRMNEADSRAGTTAIDALLNYETVKYFGNESFEARRYDERLADWEKASIRSQTSLALLNVGQGLIIAVGLTVIMVMAGQGVVAGTMTLGDFVLVNAFLIQLYIPLNFLGTLVREIQHSLTDMERMFRLLDESQEIADRPGARPLAVDEARVEFDDVSFGYRPDRKVLDGVSFVIEGGRKLAVVGTSGAGKSTLARLLFRFYDVSGGAIRIDGQDIRDVTLASLRATIGVVPQDTVLFNDSIGYNIRYGRPDCTETEMREAARHAHMAEFIESLPEGYDTLVGERGLKLSGGEKQRIAIARTILKNPPILILDEATSALDSHSERAIQAALAEIAANRTTLVIAHRLSTVVDADRIVVLDRGRIVEQGSHTLLLSRDGPYARLWRLQQERSAKSVA